MTAHDPHAFQPLLDQQRIERLLREALPAGMPPRLQARLASIPVIEPHAERSSWWPARHRGQLAWGAGATALAAATVLGLMVGASGPLPTAFDEDTVDLAALAYGPQLDPGDEP